MTELKLILNEPAWPDLADKAVIVLGADAPPIQIASLAHGTASGAPSIMLRLDLPDGRTVVAEMTLRMFVQAAKLLVAKHGDPDPDMDPPMVYMADLTGMPAFVREIDEPKKKEDTP